MSTGTKHGSDAGAAFMGLIFGGIFIGLILWGIVVMTNRHFEGEKAEGTSAAETR